MCWCCGPIFKELFKHKNCSICDWYPAQFLLNLGFSYTSLIWPWQRTQYSLNPSLYSRMWAFYCILQVLTIMLWKHLWEMLLCLNQFKHKCLYLRLKLDCTSSKFTHSNVSHNPLIITWIHIFPSFRKEIDNQSFFFYLAPYRLDPKNGKWFLVQTNYDPIEKPPFFDDRRTPATKCMTNTTQKVGMLLLT